MNIETLEYFKYIAKYKNITSAAKHLYISQSTLSRHIMSLEEELGVKLLERNNKQVELTEAGRVFYRDIDAFTDHMGVLIKNVQDADKGHCGVLRITAPSNLYHVLVKPLDIMRERYPAIRLALESYIFDETASAVKYNLYDVGLTYEFASHLYEEIDFLKVGTEKFSMIVPARYGKDLTIEAIAPIVKELPLILPSHVEPPFLKSLLSMLQSLSKANNIETVSVNTTESCLLNVALGIGFGIITDSCARIQCSRNQDITVINLQSEPTATDIIMLYKSSSMSPITNNFIDIVRELQQGE